MTPLPLPREIQVEVTGACNLRCRMCLVRYREAVSKRDGAMSFETFRGLLDANPRLRKVTLQGLGEPLLNPSLLRMIEECKRRGLRCGFNSNGTLLSAEAARALVALGTDWVHISLDGAAADVYRDVRDGAAADRWERAWQGLDNLTAAKTAADARLPYVAVVFVAMKRNVHDLPEVVRRAGRRPAVDEVWVQNLSHDFSDGGAGYAEIRAYARSESVVGDARATAHFARAEREAAAAGLKLRLPALEPRAPTPRRRGEPACGWPFQSSYVTHRGEIQPCCMVMGSDRATMGRLDEARFDEIWDGDALREFRARLTSGRPPAVCEGCSLYKRTF